MTDGVSVRGDGVGELGIVLDLLDHTDHLGRHLLVELHIIFKLVDDRARQGLCLNLLAGRIREHKSGGLIVFGTICVVLNFRPRGTLDQHLDGAVRQLEQLEHVRERPDLVDRSGRRIVVRGVLLRGQQDERVGAHHLFQRLDRFFAPDEKGHDHVREDDNVAQRQHWVGSALAGDERGLWLCAGHGPKSLLLCPSPVTRSIGVTVECRSGPARATRLVDGNYRVRRRVDRKPSPEISIDPSYAFARIIGGDGAPRCQVNPKIQGNSALGSNWRDAPSGESGRPAARRGCNALTRSRRPSDPPGRHRCRAAAPCPRRPLSRSRPPPRPRGSAGRTSCRAGFLP